jgi:DNA-binding NarL/FixJ family response regulator
LSAETPRPVAALVQDLFFSSRIADAVKRTGRPAIIEAKPDAFVQRVRAGAPILVLIDLGIRGADWESAVARLRADAATNDVAILAFGPHRDLAARDRALAVGCAEVVANSKLVTDLPNIIERYAGEVERRGTV